MAMTVSEKVTTFMQMRVPVAFRTVGNQMHDAGKADSVLDRSKRVVKDVVTGKYGKGVAVDVTLTSQAGHVVTGGM